MAPNRISPPSASSTAGTDGMIGNGAKSGCGFSRRWRSAGCTAIGAPVCAATAALSPMWSQCPWVLTISLRVQPRSSSAPVIQGRDGVAVSMAIASRVDGSARM